MLRHRVMVAAVAGAALILGVPAGARAEGGSCDQAANPYCQVDDGVPGTGGGGNNGGGSGGGNGCSFNGQSVPCQDSDYGAYVGGGCYWKALDPPPTIAPPAGEDANSGAWGVQSCFTDLGDDLVAQNYQWQANGAVAVSPAELAQQALAKIRLLGAQIGVAPDPAGSGAVGLPVWLWTDVTPGTWGPQTASASAGGITVNLTAKATRIVWSMGDGQSVTCDNPGTRYEPRFGNSASPTCGYRYASASSTAASPHGRYTVTATTSWTVTWAGGGQSGVLNPTSQSQASVEIGEIQVVNQ